MNLFAFAALGAALVGAALRILPRTKELYDV